MTQNLKKFITYFLFFFFINNTLTFTQNSSEKIELTYVVDSAAHFTGGNQAYNKFILQNLRYPIEAQKNKIQGKIYVTFIVLASGKLTNIITSDGANKHLADEAKRLILIMPDWVPAYFQGKPVNSQTNLPITFKDLGFIVNPK